MNSRGKRRENRRASMVLDDDEDVPILSAPLLLPAQLETTTQYGSSANTAVTIMQRSPLILNDKACLIVWDSNTVYKSGKPRTECYEICIMSSCTIFAQPLSEGVWRTFKEFRWLRRFFLKQYPKQKIPSLPPNYLFRKDYDRDVVQERIKGLQEFLKGCLQVKHIVSDLTFHLFIQSDFLIEDIKRQQSNNSQLSFFMCFWVCGSRTLEDTDDNTIFSNDDIDYKEFKKELEHVLKENEDSENRDSTNEHFNHLSS